MDPFRQRRRNTQPIEKMKHENIPLRLVFSSNTIEYFFVSHSEAPLTGFLRIGDNARAVWLTTEGIQYCLFGKKGKKKM